MWLSLPLLSAMPPQFVQGLAEARASVEAAVDMHRQLRASFKAQALAVHDAQRERLVHDDDWTAARKEEAAKAIAAMEAEQTEVGRVGFALLWRELLLSRNFF